MIGGKGGLFQQHRAKAVQQVVFSSSLKGTKAVPKRERDIPRMAHELASVH